MSGNLNKSELLSKRNFEKMTLFNLRRKHLLGSLKNTSEIRKVRRSIAQLETELSVRC